jgi:hypothetical protein
MTGRSSLLAAVMPIPAVGRRRFRHNLAGRACIGSGDTSSPTAQKENIGKLIFLTQSNDADRPPSAAYTAILASSPILFVDQLSIPEKDGSLLSKRHPYSGVQRCPQRHAPTTNSSGSRPWSRPPQRNCHPQGRADSPPLTNRPDGHRTLCTAHAPQCMNKP